MSNTNKENLAKIKKSIGSLKARLDGSDEPQTFGNLPIATLRKAKIIILNKIPTEAQRIYLVKMGAWDNTRIVLEEC